MSGVPRYVVRESGSPTQRVSSETSYKPSWCTETPYETSERATARRASVMAPPHHSDPNEGSARRRDQGATSKDLGSHNSDKRNARRGLKYSSTTSRTEDSERIISELHREIRDLKQEARSGSPAKERPRTRVNASNRKNPEYSTLPINSRNEDFSETSSSQSKLRSRTPPTVPKKPLESRGHSWSRSPLHGEKGHSSRKTTRPGEQNAVWRALDLVEEVAIRTFKLGLPTDMGLRQSLTKRPAQNLGKLMHRIDKFIRVEEDGRGTPPVQTVAQPKANAPKPAARTGNAAKSLSTPSNFVAPIFRAFKTIFKELIYKIMEKIKRKPFFVWPPKLLGNLALRDGKLYCTYHKDTGHMTENCHMLKVHLEKLVSAGHLNQYVDADLSNKREPSQAVRQTHSSGVPSAGVIHVIHNPLCSAISPGSYRSEIQKAAHLRRSFSVIDSVHPAPMYTVSGGGMEQVISFSDSDLKDVQLPHNDPLDLYMKLGLSEAELSSFTSPIFGFSREPTVPLGKTILPVLAGPINLQTEFIMVKASSPYNAIMGRDWLHRIRVIPSTLYQKLRFPTKDGIMELNGDQVTAKQSIVQKRRKLALERAAIVLEEVERLLASGAIREVQYPVWLSNMVVVKKKNGKWRVCIDFTDLNKACPKDPFPFPRIDQLVNSASGHARLSFLDAFQGYHQISMSAADQDKIAFITPKGTYYYKVMSFGLKNAGATYQRLVTKMFEHMIGKTVEVYIDNMLVKSLREENHVANLLQVFNILRESRLRLNASKCTFGVSSGKFLGHLVQRLTGMVAALSRFILRKAMDETELRYLPLEKAALALLQTAKKLPHYFQSSTVTVLSDLPLKMLLQRSDFSGRITRWGVHLGSLSVEYKPRTAIKGQVLAEFQYDPSNPSILMPAETQLGLITGKWELFVDEASNSKGSGAGIVLVSPEGLILEQAIRLKFSASYNEAEYETLLIGLKTAKKLGASHLQIFCDSQLVVNQISGEYQAKDERMSAYLIVARTLLAEFDSTHAAQIGREHNSHADILAKLATALESDIQITVCIEMLDQPSFQNHEVSVCSISDQPSWMDPILSYLQNNKLPKDKKEAKMIKRKAPRYWVSKEGLLYRRSFTRPYLLCVHPEMVKNFLFEIHEGICGSHTGGRSLAHRAISQGYWWPYMQADALKYVQECDKCQRFAPMIHQPARELNPLSSPWPFAQWGLDIVGPLPRAPGNKRNFFSSPGYPQSNGQAEVSNKIILNGIKRKLEAVKGKWVEELPSVLWTHRTIIRKSTGKTPFALAFGVEAVIPLEVGMSTTRTTEFVVETNEENLRKDLDLLEERRDLVVVRLASNQQRIKKENDKNIKPRVFRVEELVLRKVMTNTRKPNEGKLRPNWEGPYKVLSQAGHGAFRLEDMDGKPIPRPWNTYNLRKYFF
uniref:RNase H type-1 domain-containing protein n=1 Tax=Fagus sylvatica TaxID=28930 RepID=A0A2N9GJR4_FAGSY